MHLIRSVPDLDPRNPAAAETRALLARNSVIIHADHLPFRRVRQPDCLMITTVFGRAVRMRMGDQHVVLQEGFYFVANASCPREIEPCGGSGGEVLSVLPHENFVFDIMVGDGSSGRAFLG